MLATISDSGDRRRLAAWFAVCLVAAGGLLRLEVDPQAGLSLDPQDPVESADRTLRTATGSDDVVAVVLRRSQGSLGAADFAAVDAVFTALVTEPSLTRTRAVTRAPVLGGESGVLTATTPLHPLPTADGFDAALGTVLADRFSVGTMISPDGTLTVLPSWVRREAAETLLVGIGSKALQDEATRTSEHGAQAKRAIDEGRLAVLLGDAAGPADAEVGRRLSALAEQGNSLARSWAVQAHELASEPDAAAFSAASRALAGVSLPSGLVGTVIGASAVESALSEAYPLAIGLLVAGLLLGVCLAGWRDSRSLTPALVSLGAAGFVAGGMGWLGVPMHGTTALLPAMAVLLSGAAAAGTTPALRTGMAMTPLIALALTSAPTPGLSQGLLLCVAAVLGAGFAVTHPSAPEPTTGSPGLRSALVAGLVGAAVLGSQPVGLHPGGLLDRRAPLGQAMAALDAFGMATPAQLAFDGGEARALARPEHLATLAAAQRSLEANRAVLATVSWADFVQALHHAVSGAHELPSDPALVDQYLLLFGRPDDVRPLVAPDFRTAGGLVRLAPGAGARLGALAGPVADGPVVLTGAAARVSRAGWLASRRALAGGGAGIVFALCVLGAFFGGVHRRSAAIGAASAVVAAAIAAGWAGAVGVEAALAACTVWALCIVGIRPAVWAGVGAAAAVVSPVVPVAAFGLGLAGGALVAIFSSPPPGTVRAR